MIHPKRLLEGDGTDIERLLLKSGRAGRPSRRAKWRTGVLFFLMGLGTVSKAHALTLFGAKARAWTIAQWLALGVGTGAVGWAAAHAKTEVAPVAIETPADAPGHRPATAARSPEESPAVVPQPLPVQEGPPAPISRTKRTSPLASAPAATHPAVERSIANEIEELDRAREALGTGEAKRAIDRLNRYDRLFPRGTLREEALRLRIEAVVTTGDRATARTLAQRFQALYPGSTHSDRLKALVREP